MGWLGDVVLGSLLYWASAIFGFLPESVIFGRTAFLEQAVSFFMLSTLLVSASLSKLDSKHLLLVGLTSGLALLSKLTGVAALFAASVLLLLRKRSGRMLSVLWAVTLAFPTAWLIWASTSDFWLLVDVVLVQSSRGEYLQTELPRFLIFSGITQAGDFFYPTWSLFPSPLMILGLVSMIFLFAKGRFSIKGDDLSVLLPVLSYSAAILLTRSAPLYSQLVLYPYYAIAISRTIEELAITKNGLIDVLRKFDQLFRKGSGTNGITDSNK